MELKITAEYHQKRTIGQETYTTIPLRLRKVHSSLLTASLASYQQEAVEKHK